MQPSRYRKCALVRLDQLAVERHTRRGAVVCRTDMDINPVGVLQKLREIVRAEAK